MNNSFSLQSVALVFCSMLLINKGAESRPEYAKENEKSTERLKRDLPNLSGSTIVGGAHNFGTKTYVQSTQNNINGDTNERFSTISTMKGRPMITISNEPEDYYIKGHFVKKCVLEKAPQNIRYYISNGFTVTTTSEGNRIVYENKGETLSLQNDPASESQTIKTDDGTIMTQHSSFRKNKRSPQTYANNFGGAIFNGGDNNFGTKNYIQNSHSAANNYEEPNAFITSSKVKQPETFIEKCHLEEVTRSGHGSATSVIKNFGRGKRQTFSHNFGGANLQGGTHNFGQKNYGKFFKGSSIEGGKHNFGVIQSSGGYH